MTFWARKGYDVAYIEQHCDSEWSPDLGAMTYRVRVHKETNRSIDEGVQEHMARLLSNGKLGGAAEQPGKAPPITGRKARATAKGKAKDKEEPEDEEGAEDAEEEDAKEVCM